MQKLLIPDDLKDLYGAAKGVEGTGIPIPCAADRAIELIERIARLEAESAAKEGQINRLTLVETSADGGVDAKGLAVIRICFETPRMKAGELQARGDELLDALKVLVDAASVSAIPFPAVLGKAREAIRVWGPC